MHIHTVDEVCSQLPGCCSLVRRVASGPSPVLEALSCPRVLDSLLGLGSCEDPAESGRYPGWLSGSYS